MERSLRRARLIVASLCRRSAVARFWRDDRGAYLALTAFFLPILVGVAGLGVEGGFWLYNHRVVQSAADNAAFSVSTALALNSAASNADLTLQAKGVAANDYKLVDGANGATVTLNRPPVGGCNSSTSTYVGAANATEVVVTQTRSPLLSALFHPGNISICGRAIAVTSGGGACVLATGTNGTVISATKNNLAISLTGCGFFSNSADAASISVTGNNDTIVAESIGTVGGAVVDGNLKTKMSVTTGNPPLEDPYKTDALSWQTAQTAVTVTIPTAPISPTVTTTVNNSNQSCSGSSGNITPGKLTGSGNKICNLNGGPFTFLGAGIYYLPNGLSIAKNTILNISPGATLVIPAGGFSNNGGTVNFGTGAYSIYIQAGGWTNAKSGGVSGTINFGAGNYSIKIDAGGWTNSGTETYGIGSYTISVGGGGWSNSGTTTFNSGSYNFSIAGGDWTSSGTTTFGNGNYTIAATKVGGAGGNWNLGGTATLGTGTYNVTLDALWTLDATTTNFGAGTYVVKANGGWTIAHTTTIGNGNFNLTLGGDWKIQQATTFGSGNYTFKVTGGWNMTSDVTLGSGNYTFALTGDLTTTGNFTAGTGTYSGSMTNWNISGTTTTIGKGIYYLSGDFNITGGNSTVTGNYVTLVLTSTTSNINYTGNSGVFTLTPPLSGWSAGIAIWEPNTTVASPNLLASGNNSVANITGVIYAPSADVQYMGNTGTSPNCTQIIAYSVAFGGNSINLKGQCSSGVPGMKVFGQIIALVE